MMKEVIEERSFKYSEIHWAVYRYRDKDGSEMLIVYFDDFLLLSHRHSDFQNALTNYF